MELIQINLLTQGSLILLLPVALAKNQSIFCNNCSLLSLRDLRDSIFFRFSKTMQACSDENVRRFSSKSAVLFEWKLMEFSRLYLEKKIEFKRFYQSTHFCDWLKRILKRCKTSGPKKSFKQNRNDSGWIRWISKHVKKNSNKKRKRRRISTLKTEPNLNNPRVEHCGVSKSQYFWIKIFIYVYYIHLD